MKYFILTLLMLVLFSGVGNSQVLTLNSPETLAVPTATKLELKKINIDIGSKTIAVIYRFLDSTGKPIPISDSSVTDRIWRCTDSDPESLCFTDTFSFVIRTQDVGTPIGKGLRALIWSKMRADVLTGSNNATLP